MIIGNSNIFLIARRKSTNPAAERSGYVPLAYNQLFKNYLPKAVIFFRGGLSLNYHEI